jgi:hypothetical protein
MLGVIGARICVPRFLRYCTWAVYRRKSNFGSRCRCQCRGLYSSRNSSQGLPECILKSARRPRRWLWYWYWEDWVGRLAAKYLGIRKHYQIVSSTWSLLDLKGRGDCCRKIWIHHWRRLKTCFKAYTLLLVSTLVFHQHDLQLKCPL